jgi:hypothetical protein
MAGRRKGIDYDKVKEIASEISKVSKTLGVSVSLTSKVIESQFDFIRYIIQRGDFETVRFPYVGKFTVSRKMLYDVNLKNNGIAKDRKRNRSAGQRSSGNGEGVQEDTDKG